jgi:ankyrin repeat protein
VNGSVPMARIVAAAKPDYAILNRFGGTSAIPAGERGHDEYVAWVAEHTSIDLDHVNDLGWTALLEAVILGEGTARWQRIVKTLVAAGVDVSIPDKNGVTALEHAQRREEKQRLIAGPVRKRIAQGGRAGQRCGVEELLPR